MRLWDDELEAARAAIRKESALFTAGFPSNGPDTGTPQERIEARRAADAAMVFPSDHARDRWIDGPAGALRLREFRPERAEGVLLHIHGGGWTTGSPELTDLLHEALSQSLGLAVLSVDYRLAPEHPYPAAPDDCEAAALWLLDHAEAEYGTGRLLVGGESAGAHLAAVTLLRLRDRHGAAGRFCGANLVFGAYDLAGTPSARGVGMASGADILDPAEIAFMLELFAPHMTPEERRRPDLSPLYAELGGLPPALFTVGTADHLLDDTLFLAGRWAAAGNRAELLVYPDAPHACIGVPTVLSHWWPRLEAFLRACLEVRPEPAATS